ncbi:DUF4198 domain-containing protein [Rhodospira trueperi]|uniref:Uncharacterized conserved protein, contains GH25 family domain n=1 Tax=Rhodospira trueperi TaxID=69960 RepID=A0A1G7DHG3_9PROT|nr:DUF4198 domain-containing protein [Rhodospira trueperi]SDE51028.1 Uncharacterized conserved protein, contains GH25 family domain [Rhodospira trueperi]
MPSRPTRLCLLALAASVAVPASASAHSLWINAHESHVHQPPHAIVSLGWGHGLPVDDILNSPSGRVVIDRFALVDPAGDRTALDPPSTEAPASVAETTDVTVFAADLGTHKLAFARGSAPGVYQLEAVSQPNFYTQYIDTQGRTRLALTPRDAVEDAQTVLMSVKYQAFAKSVVTLGAWAEPVPLGHDLEILPHTDLSDLHVGDLVEVDVLFHGEPLNATAQSLDYITAQGTGFGQSDGFALFSYIKDGRAQFRVQSAGQWVIMVNHKEDVTPDGPLADLAGKADQVYHGATLTFTVH